MTHMKALVDMRFPNQFRHPKDGETKWVYLPEAKKRMGGINLDLFKREDGYRCEIGMDQVGTSTFDRAKVRRLKSAFSFLTERKSSMGKMIVYFDEKRLSAFLDNVEKIINFLSQDFSKTNGLDEEVDVVEDELREWTVADVKRRFGKQHPRPDLGEIIDGKNYKTYLEKWEEASKDETERDEIQDNLRDKWEPSPTSLLIIGITRRALESFHNSPTKKPKGITRAHLVSSRRQAHDLIRREVPMGREEFLDYLWYANLTILCAGEDKSKGQRSENNALEKMINFKKLGVITFENKIESRAASQAKRKNLAGELKWKPARKYPMYFHCVRSNFNLSSGDRDLLNTLNEERVKNS